LLHPELELSSIPSSVLEFAVVIIGKVENGQRIKEGEPRRNAMQDVLQQAGKHEAFYF